jgi:outer membrane receptor for ferrienterochelin and colicin
VVISFALAFVCSGALPEMEDVSLEELLNTGVMVASKATRALRSSPGIITVITRDEIRASGARDLMDVLSFVPGIYFGADVLGVVGAGMRGNWGHEGKILILLDGQELNENLYGSTPFDNLIPVSIIERIEVIRGPGSVIYGGNAELAVINIITQHADDLRAVRVTGSSGRMGNATGRMELTGQYGDTLPLLGGLELSVAAFSGKGSRSDGVYRDQAGGEFNMAGQSPMRALFLNVGARLGDFELRFIMSSMDMETRDGFDAVTEELVPMQFITYLAQVTQTIRLTDMLTLTPKLRYKRQQPWRLLDKTFSVVLDKTVERSGATLDVELEPLEELVFLVGADTFIDRGEINDPELPGFETPSGEQRQVSHLNLAVYGQVTWDTPIVDLALGARYEAHSQFGASFVPRIALTRAIDRFHVKALASSAFRAPSIENITLNPEIVPERTTTFELEAGYLFTDELFIAANVFDISIYHPIVYAYDAATDREGYFNFERTGTRGAELDIRLGLPRVSANLTYSFYTAAGKNEVQLYQVPGSSTLLLGAAAHKLTLATRVELTRDLSFNPSAVVLSARKGLFGRDANENPVVGTINPQVFVNVFVSYRNLLIEGLDVGVGVFDLFDERQQFVQPYDGAHAPLPGASREVFMTLSIEEPL